MTKKLARCTIMASKLRQDLNEHTAESAMIYVDWHVGTLGAARAKVEIKNDGQIMIRNAADALQTAASWAASIELAHAKFERANCPLCGDGSTLGYSPPAVCCSGCGLQAPHAKNEVGAVRAWNDLVQAIQRGQHGA